MRLKSGSGWEGGVSVELEIFASIPVANVDGKQPFVCDILALNLQLAFV